MMAGVALERVGWCLPHRLGILVWAWRGLWSTDLSLPSFSELGTDSSPDQYLRVLLSRNSGFERKPVCVAAFLKLDSRRFHSPGNIDFEYIEGESRSLMYFYHVRKPAGTAILSRESNQRIQCRQNDNAMMMLDAQLSRAAASAVVTYEACFRQR